ETGDQPGSDEVAGRGRGDDRDHRGRLLCRGLRHPPLRHDRVDLEAHQFFRESGKPFRPTLREPALVGHVLSLDVSKVTQAFAQRRGRTAVGCTPTCTKETDAKYLLLRERCGRGGQYQPCEACSYKCSALHDVLGFL